MNVRKLYLKDGKLYRRRRWLKDMPLPVIRSAEGHRWAFTDTPLPTGFIEANRARPSLTEEPQDD